MLSKERHVKILNILHNQTFVTVKELVSLLDASPSTIQRDLIELENRKLLVRESGGASLKEVGNTLTDISEAAVFEKEGLNSAEKQAICKVASEAIEAGDCIYIDSGTTTSYLLPFISDKNISLVTSSIYLIRKLPLDFSGKIYLLGGNYNAHYDISIGPITADNIRRFRFNHAFFSTNGINLENGETYLVDDSLGAIKKEIMKRTTMSCLLADASKYNVVAMNCWANLDEFQRVYVDSYPDQYEKRSNFIICK